MEYNKFRKEICKICKSNKDIESCKCSKKEINKCIENWD